MSESNELQHSTSRRGWWLFVLSLVVIVQVGVVCSLVPIWREREAIATLRDRGFDVWTKSRLPTIVRDQFDVDYRTAIGVSNATTTFLLCGFGLPDHPEYDFEVSIAELANISSAPSTEDFSSYSYVKANDEDLASIGLFNNLEALSLSYVNLTDAQADMIGGLPKLRNLSLASQQSKDAASVRAITRAGCLESLYLNNLVIDSETVELIASLPNLKELGIAHPRLDNFAMADFLRRLDLEELSLHHVKLTDADCRALGKMSRLTQLDLEFAAIDDSGLRHFRSLKNLRFLDVANTPVTAAGVAELERQLSDCLISIEKKLTREEFLQKLKNLDGETEGTEAEPDLSAQKNAGSQ